MLSDSTGYGGSSGTSSMYSSCVAVPSTGGTMLSDYRSSTDSNINFRHRRCEVSMEYNFDKYYHEDGYFKTAGDDDDEEDHRYSDFNSDSDSLDDIEPSLELRRRFEDQMSVDTSQSRFYGADVFDEIAVEYDQCPTEMESCFQSQFSSRINTAPFCSPVGFAEDKHNDTLSTNNYSSSGADSSIMAILTNADLTGPSMDDPSRPGCMPWKPRAPSDSENDTLYHRRSLLQETCEYHKGNSIRLRTMPLPFRASIVTNAFEPPKTGILVRPGKPFVQNITISTPQQSLNRKNRNMSPITEVMTENDVSLSHSLSNNDSGFVDKHEETYSSASSDIKSSKTQLLGSKTAPEKPPRGRMVSVPVSQIKIRKSATLKQDKTEISKVVVPTPELKKRAKHTSIRLGSCETIHFNKNDSPSQTSANIDSYGMSTSTTSSFILSAMPKKSILKQPSIKPPYQFKDPNEALFGPIEHIYECIDTDPSCTSSDEDHSITDTTTRPVSLASSAATTASSGTKSSSRRSMPDLRPELPARPFCWPFVLFPPDMMFNPRSLHAYHRRESYENGTLPLRETLESASEEADFELEDMIEATRFNFTRVARPRKLKGIARIPSILSKGM